MVKYIAHRANYDGDCTNENTISKIMKVIDFGYDVEIDVWYRDGLFLLGHDRGEHEVTFEFLVHNRDHLWIHCKDLTSFELLYNKDLNVFYHTDEAVVLTTKGYIWTYPGQPQITNSILVLPETLDDYSWDDGDNIVGICSDNIEHYKYKHQEMMK